MSPPLPVTAFSLHALSSSVFAPLAGPWDPRAAALLAFRCPWRVWLHWPGPCALSLGLGTVRSLSMFYSCPGRWKPLSPSEASLASLGAPHGSDLGTRLHSNCIALLSLSRCRGLCFPALLASELLHNVSRHSSAVRVVSGEPSARLAWGRCWMGSRWTI